MHVHINIQKEPPRKPKNKPRLTKADIRIHYSVAQTHNQHNTPYDQLCSNQCTMSTCFFLQNRFFFFNETRKKKLAESITDGQTDMPLCVLFMHFFFFTFSSSFLYNTFCVLWCFIERYE